jgi:hypothetical protein
MHIASVIPDRAQRDVIRNPPAFKDNGCRIESGMTIFIESVGSILRRF